MTPDTRPTKPHRAARIEPVRREGPTKGHEATQAIGPVTPHLPAKAPSGLVRESVTTDAHQPPSREPPDQGRPRQAERSGEQYLRLSVRVDDGQLSIVDTHVVDGPLAQTSALQGPFAYEVTDGRQLLHAGSIPDLGTVRGFAHPNGTLEQRRHHTYELSTYEFEARVPVALLRSAQLSNVTIALYRVKQPARPDAPHAVLSTESLAVQREMHLREIGRVVGLPASLLPTELSFQPPPEPPRRSQGKKIRDKDNNTDR